MDDAGLCNDCAAAASDDVLGVAATTSFNRYRWTTRKKGRYEIFRTPTALHDFWCVFANNRLRLVGVAAFGQRGDRHIHLPWLHITPCYYPAVAQLATRLLIDDFAYTFRGISFINRLPGWQVAVTLCACFWATTFILAIPKSVQWSDLELFPRAGD